MEKLMLKVENVSKLYKLGQIGGTTLREELERWYAKKLHREDPARMIGDRNYLDGDTFLALDDVSFDVKYGERVGIIGRNGAGKSTLLKLISRITAPTSGDIWLDGRVASMLEVGTGFNGELSGRENIYLNGAILGMKKKEIDAKIEDIIEFSECRQFIDTPVKRYSSGMYVKLAFAVAAHLDAELMIMDEVLAVGDMNFQKKCLEKMNDISRKEGRTILYVSHNMNTIRQLCDRCIVLDRGKMVYNGDVEKAIGIYMGIQANDEKTLDLRNAVRSSEFMNHPATITELECIKPEDGPYLTGETAHFRLACTADEIQENVLLRVIIKDPEGKPVTMMSTDRGVRLSPERETQIDLELDISFLVPGKYTLTLILYQIIDKDTDIRLDGLKDVYVIEIDRASGFNNNREWALRRWGYFYNKPIEFTESTDSKERQE